MISELLFDPHAFIINMAEQTEGIPSINSFFYHTWLTLDDCRSIRFHDVMCFSLLCWLGFISAIKFIMNSTLKSLPWNVVNVPLLILVFYFCQHIDPVSLPHDHCHLSPVPPFMVLRVERRSG